MSDVLGPSEIGELLGVSGSRVSQLARDYDDFPDPVGKLSRGRVWSRSAVEAWIARHPERRPGRPRKSASSTG